MKSHAFHPDSEPRQTTRVVIVDDEHLYRDLLKVALSHYPQIEVVATFPDGASALQKAPELNCHVALLDIELRCGMNGIQVGLRLRERLPNLGIVLLSNHSDPTFVSAIPREAIAGWSYLLKKSVSDVEALRRAIEGAAAGLVVLDPQLTQANSLEKGGQLTNLTPRQREILDLIALGYTNAAIADRLCLSPKSVENQINVLYQQLGIDRTDPSIQPRVTAVLKYLREGRFRA